MHCRASAAYLCCRYMAMVGTKQWHGYVGLFKTSCKVGTCSRGRQVAHVSMTCSLTRVVPKRRDFSIPFSDTVMKRVEKLVGREGELENVHNALVGNGTRRTLIRDGLGRIGKTQLVVAYVEYTTLGLSHALPAPLAHRPLQIVTIARSPGL